MSSSADELGLVAFAWAGTLVDFACRTPPAAFQFAFEKAGLPFGEAVVRRPMGAHKRDHVREVLADPEVAERARTRWRRVPGETLVDEIHREFTRGLPSLLAAHADAIPGAAGILRWSRERGIRTGSTSGLIARSCLVARQEPLQQRRPSSIRRTKYAG